MTRQIKVLVVGAAGQVGRALAGTSPADVDARFLTRHQLDVTDIDQVRSFVDSFRPDVIINAAAYTAVDSAEGDVAAAMSVNAAAAGNLARAGVRMIHISTDFVFDGSSGVPYQPDDATAPLNVYGRSKLAGEKAVLAALGKYALVVRTSWVYEAHGRNFLQTILRILRERGQVNVVDDQISTPTSGRSLATVLWRFVRRPDLYGTFHWTDAGVASWYDFAVAISEEGAARGLIAHQGRVRPIQTREFPTPARRPAFSVLDKRLTIEALGVEPIHWRVSLRAVMEDLDRA